MKKSKTTQPPRLATRFLAWYCRPELLEDLQGDLNEIFQRNLEQKGAFTAKLIYILDVLKFMRGYTLRKPSLPRTNTVMLASYFKTSGRVILRNKLFSGINIAGLALSMSVGLLVISLVSDLYSYDAALQNKDRIYRIVTTIQPSGQRPIDLATSSWKTGTLIRREIPGVESLTILDRDFSGDANTGVNRIPVGGLYADEQFFSVFSFPLLKGIVETALKEPHSLVLTQTTAKKLFGNADPMGRAVKFDTVNYTVTGVMKDIPKLSHIHFELLISLSSIDVTKPGPDGNHMDWSNVTSNYIYVLLSKNRRVGDFTTALAGINERENRVLKDRKMQLSVQPLKHIVIGKGLGNEIGPSFNPAAMFILCGLALVILLSACFNYTNLSIARSLGRSREVGIRKVIGASKGQVAGQFISESVLISLFSLCVAFLIFLSIRKQFLDFAPQLENTFSLNLSPGLVLYYILLAIIVGTVSGFLPSLFYSKINAVQVLKKTDTLRAFRHIGLRKVLIVIQYTCSLIFIVSTIIGYDQYKNFVHFDLGFKTDGILNIDMQGNKDNVFTRELSALPSVNGISKSVLVSSLGSIYGAGVKYKDPSDSDGVDLNVIDEHYLPLHQYTFMAGRNFTPKLKDAPETETIVNETLLRRFNIGDKNPEKALGEWVKIGDKQLTIVGVLKDFHYGTLDRRIGPTAFQYSAEPGRFVNVKISGSNVQATLTSIETLWKGIDKVHPFQARFYDEQIEEAYNFFTVTVKVIAFFALLAVCIASLGLFGMVVYTMEKRRKEVSIRKVLGASNGSLLYLLSKGFLYLLSIAALIALPLTWIFFDRVVLAAFAYHQPIHLSEVMLGLFIIGGIALLMIGLQTLRIVRSNPATVLKTE